MRGWVAGIVWVWVAACGGGAGVTVPDPEPEPQPIEVSGGREPTEAPPTPGPRVDVDAIRAHIGPLIEAFEGTAATEEHHRLRITLLRALGDLGDRRATPVLIEAAFAEQPSPLINRLALQQLGRLEDPAAVPRLIEALYWCAPSQPQFRMNDVAAEALVRIGRPALPAVTETLAGRNAAALAAAQRYVAAVAAVAPDVAQTMQPEDVVASEAAYVLGQLGLPESIDPLLAETQSSSALRRMSGALALVSIIHEPGDDARIRDAMIAVYRQADAPQQMQLLVAMGHLIDPGALPFFLAEARRPEDELIDHRMFAFRAYALLADRRESRALRVILRREPRDEPSVFRNMVPLLDAADRCDRDLACWRRSLESVEPTPGEVMEHEAFPPIVVRKSAYMLARFGRFDPATVRALIAQLDHREGEVRGDVFYALDFVAVNGSPEAVTRIDEIRAQEEGRAIWAQFESLANTIQARLRARAR